jgi:very-short-patch-repair endonuclease
MWKNPEYRKKISQARRKTCQNPIFRATLSAAIKKKWQDEQYRQRVSKGMKPIMSSPEYRRKQSRVHKTLWQDPMYREIHLDPWLEMVAEARRRMGTEFKLKITKTVKKLWQDPLFREKHSKAMRDLWKDPDYRDKHEGTKRSPQFIEALRKRTIMRWQDPDYRQKAVRAWYLANNKRPTEPEKQLGELIQQTCPNEYRYVGDGQVIIDGKCPDFINCNGQKRIIEMFGDYWHKQRVKDRTDYKRTEEGRKEAFAKLGYETLVIWEHELKQPETVVAKIKVFALGGTS